MSYPLIHPLIQFFDGSGAPLSSGTIEFRNPDTDAYIPTYPTADDADAATNANSNPITLNSRGEAPAGIYLVDDTPYKIILKDSDATIIWTQTDVRCPKRGNFYATTATETSAGVTISDAQYAPGNVLRYGADPTGGSSSTSAVQDAFDSGAIVYLPPGTYLCGALSTASQVHIRGDGRSSILKAAADIGGIFITLSGAKSSMRDCHLDLSNQDDYQGLSVSGADSIIDITADGMGAKLGAASANVAGIVVTAADCQVKLVADNFANGGAANASFPAAIAINSGASDCQVDLTCFGGASGIRIADTTPRPYLRRVECHNMTDNGVYNLGSTDLVCDQFSYWGGEEAWAEQGTRSYIASLHVRWTDGTSTAVGLEDATDLRIGTLTVFDAATTDGNETSWYVGTRTGNTSSSGLYIGTAYIMARGDGVIGFTNGTMNNVQIDNLHIDLNYFVATQQKSIYNHTTGDRVKFGNVYIRLTDDTAGLSGSDSFTWTLPASLTAQSFIRDFEFDDNGTGANFRMINVAQDNLSVFFQDADNLGTAPRVVGANQAGGRQRKILYGSAAPTAGTWQAGDIVLDNTPSAAGTIGWVCTTGGTSGTWKTFGTIAA